MRGPAGAAPRGLEGLEIKLPRWDTLMDDDVKMNCRHVCPSDVEKTCAKVYERDNWSRLAEEQTAAEQV